MKSHDIVEWGQPLQLRVRETPRPQGSEVLVKVAACGICHSDLHIQGGSLDLGNGARVTFESVGVELPFTLGHEIVGAVAAAGPDSTAVPGTPCVVYPWAGCGECRHCMAGDELSCEAGRALGTRRHGGYADHVMVAHQRYLLDFGELDPLLAATCACSGLTAYSALKKLPELSAADSVLLIGAGGLGLAALGLASMLTEARIVVGDIDPSKLALAQENGAHDVLDLSAADAAKNLRRLLGEGVRAVVDFVGSPETVGFALKVAGRGAAVVVVGLYGGALPLSTALLPMRNLNLRGSYVGSLQEMKDLLTLLRRVPVMKLPLHVRPLSDINRALADLSAGRVAGRLVAVID